MTSRSNSASPLSAEVTVQLQALQKHQEHTHALSTSSLTFHIFNILSLQQGLSVATARDPVGKNPRIGLGYLLPKTESPSTALPPLHSANCSTEQARYLGNTRCASRGCGSTGRITDNLGNVGDQTAITERR